MYYNSHYWLGFAGLVTAVAAWSIWGSDMFPAAQDPVGGELFLLFHEYPTSPAANKAS